MKSDFASRLRLPPRLGRRDLLMTLIPALIWAALTQARPWLIQPSCTPQPTPCTKESVFVFTGFSRHGEPRSRRLLLRYAESFRASRRSSSHRLVGKSLVAGTLSPPSRSPRSEPIWSSSCKPRHQRGSPKTLFRMMSKSNFVLGRRKIKNPASSAGHSRLSQASLREARLISILCS